MGFVDSLTHTTVASQSRNTMNQKVALPTPAAVAALSTTNCSNFTKHPVVWILSVPVAPPLPQPSVKTLQQVSGTSSEIFFFKKKLSMDSKG